MDKDFLKVIILHAQVNVLDSLVLDWKWSDSEGHKEIDGELQYLWDDLINKRNKALTEYIEKQAVEIVRPSKEY